MSYALPWEYDDGGREAAGYRGSTGDCVTRAIAIATELPYSQVYDELFVRGRVARARGRKLRGNGSPRNGVERLVYHPFLNELGWYWVATCKPGDPERVHLRRGELPDDEPLICRLSRHLSAVVDGVIRDTFDPSRDGGRMVYGYFAKAQTIR